jgi:hypothetical protein
MTAKYSRLAKLQGVRAQREGLTTSHTLLPNADTQLSSHARVSKLVSRLV